MHDNIAKKRSKSLVIPTGKTTNHMAFKFLNQARLKLILCGRLYVHVFVCVCVCVSAPEAINN